MKSRYGLKPGDTVICKSKKDAKGFCYGSYKEGRVFVIARLTDEGEHMEIITPVEGTALYSGAVTKCTWKDIMTNRRDNYGR